MEQRIDHPFMARVPAAAARRRPWTAEDIEDQRGRIAIVTGANSGLGFLTSLELARHGAHVIMTARDPARGRIAWERIRAALADSGGTGSVELRELDLADLEQVQRFSERLWEDGVEPDLLVNNAGVMMPPHTLTRQGHELQFGVNHLAHFALTALLWPRMQRRRDARIVTVSSDLHKR
ncbi:MAG TPA: SDR family NAD(P)-dependent oxidoreductase, partial [Burkholderiaceae bacterium]|nr:SDR family NAD(P)-dependent oxidoreductase [Burkholderiaceae bacterium]